MCPAASEGELDRELRDDGGMRPLLGPCAIPD